ncbi:sugar ABC transporter ATP-binding protein [Sodalis sp. dw_96]|uniref:sugar ABC transporter ATP-binding protein n=1 Tax=Sodalis sp. dw_96 TaxID=2719794 RepID=UPI001BD29B8D|nr:sugar ABC transporter ATP-binding protein [Sodalis sp. dw_96]
MSDGSYIPPRPQSHPNISGPAISQTGRHCILQARGITKHFPGVRALDAADFDLRYGEIHGVCGENGAGKSTLMKILAGIYQPDQGSISLRGETVLLDNPLSAKRQGILLVHQELSVVPELTVAENIYLGALPLRSFSRVDWPALFANARRVLALLGCDIEADTLVGALSVAQQQQVEIARALAFESSIVIFDEPTASLTHQEADRLFATIGRLKKQGVSTVYISHKMREIFAITERITLLRDGAVTGVLETAQTHEHEVTRLMIGRPLSHFFVRAKSTPGTEILRVENLSIPGRVDNVSFSVRTGEVVGLYGLIGSGRSEIAESLFGMLAKSSGRVFWQGHLQDIRHSRDAIRLGMALVPEDRKRQGLIPALGARDNIMLAQLDKLSRFGFIRRATETAIYESYRKTLRISAAGPGQETATLSGGNQQKVVIARWLSLSPRLLILDEPTRGIDVGAKAEIHTLIAALAEQGLAVLVISSEMPEIMGISHRIITVAGGRITDRIPLEDFSEDRIINGAMAIDPPPPVQ